MKPVSRFLRSIVPACAALLSVNVATSFAAEVNLFAFGDWGQKTPEQLAVGKQIAAYAVGRKVHFDAALLLGDNFYGKMPAGVDDERWQKEFEDAYDAKTLPMPFYAALGNHDYEEKKAQAQMDYSRLHPRSRWKLPAKWYRVDIPATEPLVTVLVLDSNIKNLGKKEWASELDWLKHQLANPRNGKWTIATAHHPLFTAGQHGDTKDLVADWGPIFKERHLNFFLCGHDHDLQHLEIEGWQTSFILAGGGGAKIRPMKRDDRGPFSRSLNGFFHLRLDDNQATGRFIDIKGQLVHEFTRTADGKVSVMKSTGRDKPGKDKGEGK